jgi:hypothetical protein
MSACQRCQLTALSYAEQMYIASMYIVNRFFAPRGLQRLKEKSDGEAVLE